MEESKKNKGWKKRMSNAYSYDLRKKVIEAIELNGMKKSEVSQIFGISRNTIDLWLKCKKETGDFRPLTYTPPGHSQKITDWEKFRSFAEQNAELTQRQMADKWDGEISERTISRALKKIGFTRKKKLMDTGNETK